MAGLESAMELAATARARGLDPRTGIEIPVASDLADRVEALLGYTGIAARIRRLEQEMSREEAALRIGDDFVARKFGETTSEEILDHAIRAAMALLTEGVVAAPTEGIAKVSLGKNDDGTDYLKVYYAGPIRAPAGRLRRSRCLWPTTSVRRSGSDDTSLVLKRLNAISKRFDSTTTS